MPTPPMQYSHIGAPLVALGALLVMMLLCRWVFSTTERDQRTARRLEKARPRGDYGLLVPVAQVRTADDAELLRGVLREAGIRGTVAEGERPGERVVLVFRADTSGPGTSSRAERPGLLARRALFVRRASLAGEGRSSGQNCSSGALSRRTSAPSATSLSTNPS